MIALSPEEVSAVAGVMLSLSFSYLPGVREKFAALTPTNKRLVMLALLAAVTIEIFALGCIRPEWLAGAACTEDGAWAMLRIFAVAVIANQAAFDVSPRGELAAKGHGYGQ